MITRTPFIIGEISGNHGGSLDTMLSLIGEAHKAGCDAVKFQFYDPQQMPDYAGNERLYEECRVPFSWLKDMFSFAEKVGAKLFSSVFEPAAVDILAEFNPFAYKIASPESTRLSFETYKAIAAAVRTQPPAPLPQAILMISSGLKDMAMMQSLHPDVLMYCRAGYPATLDFRDLQIVHFLESKLPGFSDHTAGIIEPLAMIQAGAKVIEKHFKVNESCVDAAFSLNPEQMKLLCDLAHSK